MKFIRFAFTQIKLANKTMFYIAGIKPNRNQMISMDKRKILQEITLENTVKELILCKVANI